MIAATRKLKTDSYYSLIGDQFLNTGNDFAARSICPCVWITSPEETTYILKSILRFTGIPYINVISPVNSSNDELAKDEFDRQLSVDFNEVECRLSGVKMDVYTGEMKM